MTAKNHADGDVSANTDFDYEEIIRSGRELINSVYETYSRNPVPSGDSSAREAARSRNVTPLNRYLQDVDENLRRIDRFVTSITEETLRSSAESLADISTGVVDLVNIAATRRNRRRPHPRRNVIGFVDLCSPPSTGRRESLSSDVEITGVQQLPERASTNRRRKFPQTNNNNHGQEGNDSTAAAPPPSSAESPPKIIRSTAPSADDITSPKSDSYKCPICLEFVKSRCPTTTKCGHIFCHECISTVLKVSANLRKCPLCTKKIGLRDLVRIYL